MLCQNLYLCSTAGYLPGNLARLFLGTQIGCDIESVTRDAKTPQPLTFAPSYHANAREYETVSRKDRYRASLRFTARPDQSQSDSLL